MIRISISLVLLIQVAFGQTLPQNSLSYAPTTVECPTDVQWVRPATNLSTAEANWVEGRKNVVLEALEAYLDHLNFTGFNVSNYLNAIDASNNTGVPILGLAISGGGFQSGYTGTGLMRAMDDRLNAANEQRIGGLLQSMTYISGLSGGSMPVVSFAVHNFPTADDILDAWMPEVDTFDRTDNQTAYTQSIFEDIAAKAEAGYNVSTADYFGRGYSWELVPGAYGGVNTTWSGVQNLSKFKEYRMPFPIIQGVEMTPNDPTYFNVSLATSNSTIYDITPFEFGAWNGTVSAFTPTEYLGTYISNGSPLNSSACTIGFDKAGFIIGSVSAAMNMWWVEDMSNNTLGTFSKRSTASQRAAQSLSQVRRALRQSAQPNISKRYVNFPLETLESLFEAFGELFNLTMAQTAYAVYPNPFIGLATNSTSMNTTTGVNTTTTTVETSPWLNMVDGSESGQTIPLWGQIQPARGVDFLIAYDSSSDAQPYNWDNGTNIYDTFLAANRSSPKLAFPIIPPASTFIARNYTTKPVFFGCSANLTTTGDTNNPGPLVLYLANSPYSAYTNFTFTQNATSRAQMNEIFVNSFNMMTQGNGTLDSEWPECLGCAVVDRSLHKLGLNRTAQCESCFERYCWDGTVIGQPGDPTQMVDPTLRLSPNVSFTDWLNAGHPF